jgi:hypothetical protein
VQSLLVEVKLLKDENVSIKDELFEQTAEKNELVSTVISLFYLNG